MEISEHSPTPLSTSPVTNTSDPPSRRKRFIAVLPGQPPAPSLVSAEKAAEIDPNGSVRLIRVPGAGHSMHRDAFERFVALVRDFVRV